MNNFNLRRGNESNVKNVEVEPYDQKQNHNLKAKQSYSTSE
jgi:hypothetical protein